jgi:DNA-binding beta-propeller fold protein YncE
VGKHPLGLAVVSSTNKIYAANLHSWDVTAIRGSDHTTITHIYVGAQACKAAADSEDARVYATNHLESDNGAAAINSLDDTFIHYYERLNGTQGRYGIDVDPAQDNLFIAARDAGLIAVQAANLPTQDPLILKLEDVDPTHRPRVPFLVAFNPATNHLFITTPYDNLVVVLDPYSIEFDKGTWTTWQGHRVFVLKRINAAWLAEIPVGNGAEEGIAVNPLTGHVYVTNADDNTVSILQDDANPANIGWIADLEVGEYPQGVDVDILRNLIYVGNAESRDLTVIQFDGLDHFVLKTIPLD